jgi:hypothetical protein
MKHDRHTNCHTISITLDPNLFSSLSLFLFSLGCLSLLLPFLGDTLTDPSLSSLTPAFITHSLLSLSPSLRSLRHYGAALSLLFVLASFRSVLFVLPTLICFLSLRRGAYCNPWLLPPWPLARVCWLSRQPQGLTSLLTIGSPFRPLSVTLYWPPWPLHEALTSPTLYKGLATPSVPLSLALMRWDLTSKTDKN